MLIWSDLFCILKSVIFVSCMKYILRCMFGSGRADTRPVAETDRIRGREERRERERERESGGGGSRKGEGGGSLSFCGTGLKSLYVLAFRGSHLLLFFRW